MVSDPGKEVSMHRFVNAALIALAAVLAAGAAAFAFSAPASATVPDTLTRAQAIRAELNGRYARLPGRKLVVSEVSSTGVTQSITLVTDVLEDMRVVPAEDGIYFALCSARARCPYPARSASWPVSASLPRRLATELALQTFAKTPAHLVVVALPTRAPVWVVFERDDLLAGVDRSVPLDRLAGPITEARLYRPIPILPLSHETLYAMRLHAV
jgi:hypothetical protein